MSSATAYNAARLASGAITADHVAELAREFQRAAGLDPDGKVGPATVARLDAAIAASSSSAPAEASSSAPAIASRVYPLRRLADGRAPRVTSGFKAKNPDRPNHNGADLFYAYNAATDPAMKNGDGGREGRWWIPDATPAIAVASGLVELAGASRTGFRVWIDVGDGWHVGYFHLSRLAVRVGDIVSAGVEVGIVGDNPADVDARHLHFELYRGDLLADVDAGRYPRGSRDPDLILTGARIL